MSVCSRSSGAVLHHLKRHTDKITCVSGHGSEKYGASCSLDTVCEVFSLETGKAMFGLDHSRPVNAVAFAPKTSESEFIDDELRVVTGDWDGRVRWWVLKLADAGAKKLAVKPVKLGAHASSVRAVCCGASGLHAASVAMDGTVHVYSTRSLGVLTTIAVPGGSVISCMSFAAGSSRLVVGAEDGTVRVYDALGGREVSGRMRALDQEMIDEGRVKDAELEAYTPGLLAVGYTDGCAPGQTLARPLLAAGTNEGTVVFFDAATHLQLGTVRAHSRAVTCVAFSPKGGVWLASASDDGLVKLFRSADRALVAELRGHRGPVSCVCWARGGTAIATAGDDYTLRLWSRDRALAYHRDPATAKPPCVAALEGHSGLVKSCDFTPDGRVLFSGARDRTVRAWPLELLRDPEAAGSGDDGDGAYRVSAGSVSLQSHLDWVNCVCVCPAGKTLASSSWDFNVVLWRVKGGAAFSASNLGAIEPTAKLSGHRGAVSSVAFSPSGADLVSAGYDNGLTLWSVATGAATNTLPGHTERVTAVRWGSDGSDAGQSSSSLIYSVSDDGSLRSWDVTPGAQTAVFSAHAGPVNSVAVRRVRAPDAAATESLPAPLSSEDGGASPSLSALAADEDPDAEPLRDGEGVELLLTGGADGAAKLWDTSLAPEARGHQCEVSCCAANSAGVCATGARDGSVHLWRLATGKLVGTVARPALPPPAGGVTSLALGLTALVVGYGSGDIDFVRLTASTGAEVASVLPLASPPQHDGFPVSAAAVSEADPALAVTGGWAPGLHLWDTASGRCIKSITPAHTGWMTSCALVSASLAISCGCDGAVNFYNLEAGGIARTVTPPGCGPKNWLVGVVAGSGAGSAYCLTSATSELFHITVSSSPATAAGARRLGPARPGTRALASDGSHLYLADQQGVKVIKISTGEEVDEFPTESPVTSVASSSKSPKRNFVAGVLIGTVHLVCEEE